MTSHPESNVTSTSTRRELELAVRVEIEVACELGRLARDELAAGRLDRAPDYALAAALATLRRSRGVQAAMLRHLDPVNGDRKIHVSLQLARARAHLRDDR
jgi:hypothetical protein